ncbi:MAG: SLC13 family permease [Chloroflexaceae bacterium]|nr:SLC13 family permease [Chloroflexaceae bacterium]
MPLWQIVANPVEPLSFAAIYTLVVIAAALVLISSNRIAPDLVALMVLLALGVSGVVTVEQALAGFSRPAVITIIGLFVITAALERTGVVQWLSERLAQLSGKTEGRMVMVFMGAGALLSLVMNNIAAGAVLLPAAVRVSSQAGVRPSKVLMPLAFGTLLGGMATYYTTANILLSSDLQSRTGQPLSLLDFVPTGGAIDERLWEVRVRPDSPLVGQALGSTRIGERLGVTVMAIWHGREARLAPTPDAVIEANDMLLVLGREERVVQLEDEGAILGRKSNNHFAVADQSVQLAEVIIGPRSPAVGQTLKDLRFRDKFRLTTVAIWRGTRSYRTDVGVMPLQAGDALLMVGTPDRVRALAREPGYILPRESLDTPVDRRKGGLAALVTLLVISISALGWVSTPEAMLIGMVALVLAGCIRMEEAYRAVEWRVIFLIAGMLPIGAALISTGLADRISDAFITMLAPMGALALIAGLYLFTVLVTQVIGGQVAALIVGPIALTAAVNANVNPAAVAVAVAIACSASFLTPIAHPVNLLMVTPGGYRFGDFVRVGFGLTLVCFVTLLLVMPLFWQL